MPTLCLPGEQHRRLISHALQRRYRPIDLDPGDKLDSFWIQIAGFGLAYFRISRQKENEKYKRFHLVHGEQGFRRLAVAAFKVVVAQAAIKSRRGDAEYLGGLAAVPAGLFECGKYLLTFYVPKRSWR